MTPSLMRVLLLVLTLGGTIRADIPEDYEYIVCSLTPSARNSRPHTHPRIPFSSRDPKFASDSTNWSGYVAATDFTTPAPRSVSKVSGSWIVPNLQASPMDTYCSIWVGIDGSGSPTVEQIGTEHDVHNGQQQHYAWFEMYPEPSYDITGFPVETGDSISASVTYVPLNGILPLGNTLFIMHLVNNTKKMYSVVPRIATTNIQRLCAEWIVEAPYLNGILPLTNFGTVFLFNCSATINNKMGSIGDPSWVNERMNMISSTGAMKATTSPLSPDGKAFSVAWQGN